ncbi:MAG: PqqD family protein [Ruminococcaceae bacterium]|nr:PqqD family protein [Oscillospiraceae bacterium]
MKKTENYLEKKPKRAECINWTKEDNGEVVLEVENKGIANKIAQLILRKPKISYIHLDEMGSFIWPLLDGKTNIIAIGEKVEEHFGDKANPLYERLAKYIKTLYSYEFIEFDK